MENALNEREIRNARGEKVDLSKGAIESLKEVIERLDGEDG
jgi:hypothetical protein